MKKNSLLDNEILGNIIIRPSIALLYVINMGIKITMYPLVKTLDIIESTYLKVCTYYNELKNGRTIKKEIMSSHDQIDILEEDVAEVNKGLNDEKRLNCFGLYLFEVSEKTKQLDENYRVIFQYENDFYSTFYELLRKKNRENEKLDVKKLAIITYLGRYKEAATLFGSAYQDFIKVVKIDSINFLEARYNHNEMQAYNVETGEVLTTKGLEFMKNCYQAFAKKGISPWVFKHTETSEIVKNEIHESKMERTLKLENWFWRK